MMKERGEKNDVQRKKSNYLSAILASVFKHIIHLHFKISSNLCVAISTVILLQTTKKGLLSIF